MPIYSYACARCSEQWEEMRRVDSRDEVRDHSDSCKGAGLRLIDAPGAVWAPTSTGSNLK